MSLTALLFFGSCAKDIVKLDRNHPPQTFIVAAPLDSSGVAPPGDASSYRVHLYWRGEDSDGYVVGFLWEFDDSSLGNAHYTTKTDSIFNLLVNDSTVFDQSGSTPPGTSKYHTFYIRAVDNQGKVDPGIAVFNHRTFLAQTLKPIVRFLGSLPGHRTRTDWAGPGPFDSVTVNLIDTLADKTPFQVCWTGYDPDNPPDFGVPHYQWTAGASANSNGVTTDTCAYFNDPGNPVSRSVSSGLYTMAVNAYDIANAVGDSQFVFVVNYDPDTWFLPRGAPIGHYLQPFREGTVLDPPVAGTFAPGDTVPYRSTVWWDWDASDSSHGESNCIAGYSVNLQGSHNSSEPYTIGFLNDLGGGVLFKTDNPAVVGPLGYVSLILDSLDAVPNMQLFVRSQDCSGRTDGTPAYFTFSCNFPPKLLSVGYRDTCAVNPATKNPEPGVYVFWDSYDYEDGKTLNAKLTIDGTQNIELSSGEQGYIVFLSVLKGLSPGDTVGTVGVRVGDRAGQFITSDQALEAHFALPDSSVCGP